MSRKISENLPILYGCKDFDIIENHFSFVTLLMFEGQLKEYLNSTEEPEEPKPIVCWYEGMWTAEMLMDFYGINHENKRSTII